MRASPSSLDTAHGRIQAGASAWTPWLTRAALFFALVIVIVRATTSEALRDPFQTRPGLESVPRGAGPACGAVLDLLACLPALLILLRAAADRDFKIRLSWAHGLMFTLALWTTLSTLWSADRFAAAIESTHWAAAMVLLWSLSQLVQTGSRARLIGGLCFGLLLVLTAQGLVYRFVDVPDERESFLAHQDEIFRQRGWPADSFIAQQFKRKVMNGEIMGFSKSTNTYAMMLVLLGGITAGLVLQRFADGDEPGWAIAMLLALGPALLMLWLTKCRAALVTSVFAAALIAAASIARSRWPAAWRMPGFHRRAYWVAIAFIVLAVAAIIGHGLYHGSLIHDSLTFRWRYWIGSARLVALHPLRGVGFANFGPHYLSVRLLIASEEIKDPHNLFVRFAVETGVIGLGLAIAWLMRLCWEMTQSPGIINEPEIETPPWRRPLAMLFSIAFVALTINMIANVDLSQSWAFSLIEGLKRLLWMGVLFIGLSIATLHSTRRQELDDRPAPWLLWAILASLAVFLLHNMIEFGLFEAGVLSVFAMLCGTVLGIRRSGQSLSGSWLLFTAVGLTWALVAILWVAPVVIAENHAEEADELLRTSRPGQAAALYDSAFAALPLANADYAFRAASARMYSDAPPQEIRASLDTAIASDPTLIVGYLTRARFLLQLPRTDINQVRADFEKAIGLNPNDVEVRTDYAQVLEQYGLGPQAAEQYRAALDKNAGLSPDELKRLTKERVLEIEKRIAVLRG